MAEQLVVSRREFDKRIKADPDLKANIAGFSAISLYHTKKGLNEEGYSAPLFSEAEGIESLYCDLHPQVFREVFGEKANGYRSFIPLMKNNRVSYGQAAVMIEYVMTQPYAPKSYMEISYTVEVINKLKQRFYSFTRLSLLENNVSLTDGLTSADEEDVLKLFPSREDLINTLVDTRNRGGVQVFYGNKEKFSDFLKDNDAEPTDDCSAILFTPIPTSLVIAVVPLGAYEEQELLVQSV